MSAKVLFVDDDPNILAAFQRQFRKSLEVETVRGAAEGLEAIRRRGPFAVVVTDLRMPGMDGVQFLAKVKEASPNTVRMMLTGHADLQTAIEAVNEGYLFRFLTKPCEARLLAGSIADGIRQYQLIVAERELLEKTLRGSIKMMSEILQLVNPQAFGRGSRIVHYVKEVAKRIGVTRPWKLETAASLSQIGCVVLPESALQKLYQGHRLSSEEKQLFDMHPFVGSDLISHIPRLQGIAEIIAYQEKNFDGTGLPQDSLKGTEIPLGARVLKAVLDFDILHSGGTPKQEALNQLLAKNGRYDPEVLSALEATIRCEANYEERDIAIEALMDGMILAEDIYIGDGRLLVARGYHVNKTLRERLKNFRLKPGIKEPVRVLVPLQHKSDSNGGISENA